MEPSDEDPFGVLLRQRTRKFCGQLATATRKPTKIAAANAHVKAALHEVATM